MNDEVDILLATYNGEEFIAEQIESIMEQTHQKFFLVVGDDASRDSTPDIVYQYAQKNRGKVFFQQYHENVGMVLNFSRLVKFSASPYVMLSDQDDIWLPAKIEETLKKMKEMEREFGEETPLLVHSNSCIVDDDLNMIDTSFYSYSQQDPRKNNFSQVLMDNHVLGCTMMMNRALMDSAFPIPKNALLHDYWVSLVATAFGKVGFLDKKTTYYRQHGHNWNVGHRQIGCKKLLSLFREKSIRDGIFRNFYAKLNQAHIFYHRYHEQLTKEQKETLERFISIKNGTFLEEVRTRFSCGFHRSGFYRELYDILASYLNGPIPEQYKLKI
ncbi:MAG: glycosyltransferase family 2 protein [Chlamydiota bacterium]